MNTNANTLETYRGYRIQIDRHTVAFIRCFQSYQRDFDSIEAARAAVDREIALRGWMDAHRSSQGFQEWYTAQSLAAA